LPRMIPFCEVILGHKPLFLADGVSGLKICN